MKHPIVQKRIEYFKNYIDETEDQALLQTIRIPKNLLFLSDKLPQANYEKNNINKKNHSFTKKAVNELPDIRVNPSNKISGNKKIRNEKHNDPNFINDIANTNVSSNAKKRSGSKLNENIVKEGGHSERKMAPVDDEYKSEKIILPRDKSPKGRLNDNSGYTELNQDEIAQVIVGLGGNKVKNSHSKTKATPPHYDLPQIKSTKKKDYVYILYI